METPLDNVPPLFTSVAPLGIGLGLAAGCCGGGGVGAIGAAGSVFLLLENICIGKSPSNHDGLVIHKGQISIQNHGSFPARSRLRKTAATLRPCARRGKDFGIESSGWR